MKVDLKDYLATEGEKYRKRHELLLFCIKSGMIDFFKPYAFNKTNLEFQNYKTGKKFENIIETSFTVMIMNGMGRQIVHIKLCFPSIS